MGKLAAVLCMTLSVCVAQNAREGKFAKYRPIEAYEIRPGVEMIPYYSREGEVCKIVLQRQHYTRDTIALDAGMSRGQIHAAFDELAPKEQRGKPALGLGNGGYETTLAGVMESTAFEYEHVSLRMYRNAKSSPQEVYVIAIIQWKRPTCT